MTEPVSPPERMPPRGPRFYVLMSMGAGILLATALYVGLALAGVWRTEYHTAPHMHAFLFVLSGQTCCAGAVPGTAVGVFLYWLSWRRHSRNRSTHS